MDNESCVLEVINCQAMGIEERVRVRGVWVLSVTVTKCHVL